MSKLKEHALQEFKLAGWLDENGKYKDEMQRAICEDLLELLEVFSKQGHSGSSASYFLSRFIRLASFKVLSPLTGEDSEWKAVGGNNLYQNLRDSSVFKDDSGCFAVSAVLFMDSDNQPATSSALYSKGFMSSNQYISEFPFMPKIFTVDVFQDDDGIYRVKDEKQLEPVFKYYA